MEVIITTIDVISFFSSRLYNCQYIKSKFY